MRRLLFMLLIAGVLLAQNPETAVFPTAVADDEDLLVAKDNAWSTLDGAIDDNDLTIVVYNGSRFVAPAAVKIQNEFVKICSIDTNTLTVCTGGRGYVGTTPASHSSGVLVEDVWMAKHHNLLAAELIAIETALGASLAHPLNKGTTLPATCTVGDAYFKTDADAGENLYGCTSTNTWTLQSGGATVDPTIYTEIAAPAAPDANKLKVYAKDVSGVTYFCAMNSAGNEVCIAPEGVFNSSTTESTYTLKHQDSTLDAPGTSGYTAFGFSSTGEPVKRTNAESEELIPTVASSNTWTGANTFTGATSTAPHKSGTTLPGTCSVGQTYFDTDAAAGQNTYACTATDTWTLQGDGGGITPTTRGAWASRPTCNSTITGQVYYTTDQVALTSQCNGTSWQDFWAGQPITLPTAAGTWTEVNTLTIADSAGTITIGKAASGLGLALKALTLTNWDLRIAVSPIFMGKYAGTPECGLWITNGTTAGTHDARGMVVGDNALSESPRIMDRNYFPINGTLEDKGSDHNGGLIKQGGLWWIRAVKTGTTALEFYLGDGVSWVLQTTVSNSYITPTHWGVGCDARGTNAVLLRVVHAVETGS